MKLTVCFGNVKVIVPCGEGDLTVKDLIDKATWRYIKASLEENIEVDVKYLQTEDDAILHSDDIIADVCDDKDRLVAIFKERTSSLPPSFNDQTSSSSNPAWPTHTLSSTGSGHVSISEQSTQQIDRVQPVAPPPGFDVANLSKFRQDADAPVLSGTKNEKRSGREWRKEAPWKLDERSQLPNHQSFHSSSSSSTPVSSPDTSKAAARFNRFDRNLNRKSLSTAHPMLYSWIDAQERMNERDPLTDKRQFMKRFSESRDSFSGPSVGDCDDADDISSTSSEEIELETRLKEDFGLRVQGYKNADGKELGLVVHEIKDDRMFGKRSSLNVADRITEVNGVNLRGMSNAEAESVLNEALTDGAVKLKRTRSHHFIRASLRNVSLEKKISLPKVPESVILSSKEAPKVKAETKETEIHEAPIEDPKNDMPTIKPIQGNRIFIELSKGSTGLGFSITSRDIVTGGPNPVYVKNILPNGAAIKDGRLKVGDQIIEINGVDVSSKDQSEVVKILKKISGLAKLLVNRQAKDAVDQDDNEDAMETVSNDSGISTLKEEFLSITIPLNDLGSAGLGISVKGKSTEDSVDLGIFVKSIIKGGAAAKDGRLKPDDRLLQLNDVSLDGFSNDKAMDALRDALKESVKQQAKIKIFVSRKSKSDHGHIISEAKPEHQASVRSALPTLALNGSSSLNQSKFESLASPPTSPSKEKPHFNARIRSRNVSETSTDTKTRSSSAAETVKFVSVSSSEIPVTQPCKPVMIDRSANLDSERRQLVEVKSRVFPKEKEYFYQSKTDTVESVSDESSNWSATVLAPPSYHETLKRRSTSSSDTGSYIGSFKGSQTKSVANEERVADQDSYAIKPKYLTDDNLDDADLIRTMSTSSRFSVDSLMMSPDTMPFSRDAFGRLSMSERKGRAHLDATKSTLYSKLKKSKSLENVHSVNNVSGGLSKKFFGSKDSDAETDAAIVPLLDAVRRTESLDTLLHNSLITSDEEEAFQRNTALSKSTPWYVQRTVSPTALALRSRSTAWNDSFRSAVDRSSVFYTHNGVAISKPQENAIPIKMTSNANYESNQQTRKRANIFKGIGNLLKKGKPRRLESKSENRDRSVAKGGVEVTDAENGLDYQRIPRPHSMHEGMIGNVSGDISDAIWERERVKRDQEKRPFFVEGERRNVKKSETESKSDLAIKQAEDKGTVGRSAAKSSFDAKLERPSRPQTHTGDILQSNGYKSLLQRGQERILQRDRNQHSAIQPGELKPAIRQDPSAFKYVKNLPNESRESEESVMRDENPPVSTQNIRPNLVADSREDNLKLPRSKQIILGPHEGLGGHWNSKYLPETTRKNPSLTNAYGPPSHVDHTADTEEDTGSRQRYLPETPLFYYGHSSLPRKFTMNNTEKKRFGDIRQPIDNNEEKSEYIQRKQPPVRTGNRKQSNYSVGEQADISKKVQAFNRAQQGHELRTSKRNAMPVRCQSQSSTGPGSGTITISHAANI